MEDAKKMTTTTATLEDAEERLWRVLDAAVDAWIIEQQAARGVVEAEARASYACLLVAGRVSPFSREDFLSAALDSPSLRTTANTVALLP